VIVLDTHVWLWWTLEPRRLSNRCRAAIEQAAQIGVCTISCWEAAMLVERGRVELDRDLRTWIRQALAQQRVEALPLTVDVALDAALLERKGFDGDPADRIIYATARAADSALATKDARLRRFDRERTVW
jgi:PIN domain nuclease of toxin-antitoxin system